MTNLQRATKAADAADARMRAAGWGGDCDRRGHVVRVGMEGSWTLAESRRFQRDAAIIDCAADLEREAQEPEPECEI
jgi:hypothetical protein